GGTPGAAVQRHRPAAEEGLGRSVNAPGREDTRLTSLLADARKLAADDGTVAARLQHSVVRPLQAVVGDAQGTAPHRATGTVEEPLYRLAHAATRLRLEPDAPAALLEATAALHDLVGTQLPERLPALAKELRKLPPAIVVAADGPYLATNAPLSDWLGVPLPARPQLALCRCGESKLKPLCDGTHVDVGFSGAKDPQRVP